MSADRSREDEIRKRFAMLKELRRNREGQILVELIEDAMFYLETGQPERGKEILRKLIDIEPRYLV